MHLLGKKVILRAPELRDVERLNAWANDPEVWRLLGGWHFPYSLLSTEKWVAGLNNNSTARQIFCIEAPDQGLVGTANLIDIDWRNRHAEHGIMIGDKDARGKGLGRDTVMTIMRYVFDELNLTRLDSGMVSLNERSIHLYTKVCGWEIEGKKKNWYYREGRYYDKVIVGITKESYRELIERTAYWDT